MSVDDENERASLTFHKDFTDPTTAHILQAVDGTCFRFDLGILAMSSSFFADLLTLPTAKNDSDMDKLIPLPSATSSALEFTLSAIKLALRGSHPTGKTASTDDLITLAEAYDLPIALDALLHAMKAEGASAYTIFTITALANNNVEANEQALDLLGSKTWRSPQEWETQILKAKAPTKLVDLYATAGRWEDATERFQSMAMDAIGSVPMKFRCQCNAEHWHGDYRAYVEHHLADATSCLRRDPRLVKEENFCYVWSTDCAQCLCWFEQITRRARRDIPRSSYTFSNS